MSCSYNEKKIILVFSVDIILFTFDFLISFNQLKSIKNDISHKISEQLYILKQNRKSCSTN